MLHCLLHPSSVSVERDACGLCDTPLVMLELEHPLCLNPVGTGDNKHALFHICLSSQASTLLKVLACIHQLIPHTFVHAPAHSASGNLHRYLCSEFAAIAGPAVLNGMTGKWFYAEVCSLQLNMRGV